MVKIALKVEVNKLNINKLLNVNLNYSKKVDDLDVGKSKTVLKDLKRLSGG